MTEQFPDDKSEGKARTVFHILSATLDPHHSSEFADRATALIENVVAGLEGFVEGRVFEADDGKAVTLITAWETRHMWAKAHWNQQVQALIAGYAESGAAFIDAMCYGRPKIVARSANH
jgi:heme-degrading monooxygenase HmoA